MHILYIYYNRKKSFSPVYINLKYLLKKNLYFEEKEFSELYLYFLVIERIIYDNEI